MSGRRTTGGMSHYTALRVWEKIHFKKQELRSLALDDDGHIWIGTNEGAWKYTPKYTNAKGRQQAEEGAEEPASNPTCAPTGSTSTPATAWRTRTSRRSRPRGRTSGS